MSLVLQNQRLRHISFQPQRLTVILSKLISRHHSAAVNSSWDSVVDVLGSQSLWMASVSSLRIVPALGSLVVVFCLVLLQPLAFCSFTTCWVLPSQHFHRPSESYNLPSQLCSGTIQPPLFPDTTMKLFRRACSFLPCLQHRVVVYVWGVSQTTRRRLRGAVCLQLVPDVHQWSCAKQQGLQSMSNNWGITEFRVGERVRR